MTPDHPEWAAVWGLTLKDRWHEGNSFIPWVGRDSASDVSVYGQQKVFFVNCFLMHAYNQIEHLKGRRGRNLLTVLCEELNTFFLMRVDEREIDSQKSLLHLLFISGLL